MFCFFRTGFLRTVTFGVLMVTISQNTLAQWGPTPNLSEWFTRHPKGIFVRAPGVDYWYGSIGGAPSDNVWYVKADTQGKAISWPVKVVENPNEKNLVVLHGLISNHEVNVISMPAWNKEPTASCPSAKTTTTGVYRVTTSLALTRINSTTLESGESSNIELGADWTVGGGFDWKIFSAKAETKYHVSGGKEWNKKTSQTTSMSSEDRYESFYEYRDQVEIAPGFIANPSVKMPVSTLTGVFALGHITKSRHPGDQYYPAGVYPITGPGASDQRVAWYSGKFSRGMAMYGGNLSAVWTPTPYRMSIAMFTLLCPGDANAGKVETVPTHLRWAYCVKPRYSGKDVCVKMFNTSVKYRKHYCTEINPNAKKCKKAGLYDKDELSNTDDI